MKAVLELEQLGYTFSLDGGTVRYSHSGERPAPERVQPLLDYLRRHREEAVSFLRERICGANGSQTTAQEHESTAWIAELERGLRARLPGVEFTITAVESLSPIGCDSENQDAPT